MGQKFRHCRGLVGTGVNHDAAGELRAGEIPGNFFPIFVLPVRESGVHPAQIMIEKNQIETLGCKNFERRCGGFGEPHSRQSFPEPAEAILGVVEDEDSPMAWDVKNHDSI